MALGSTALLPRLCSFPTAAPLRSSFKNFISFSRSSFLPPPSSQLHSHRVFLLARLSSPFSNSLSSEDKVEDDLGAEEEEERRKPLTPPPPQATEPVIIAPLPSFPTPQLTIKEKKELASYAHSLGKKLKSQQIGKSGVTSSVAAAMVESLQSNELLKLKVHGSCPGELSDVIKQLESSTGSTAVSQIGRTLILYRPSPVKMEEDAKRSRMLQQRKKNHIKRSEEGSRIRNLQLSPETGDR
ncbi:hypothetical protein KSP39_PZI009701 [Platanthera zijinensis]|uniref:CRM domain-containing protein n=1 Tax=Platanthera zijinensis TaxID=2320716 RepID=A0AAP0BJH4_9ASPA